MTKITHKQETLENYRNTVSVFFFLHEMVNYEPKKSGHGDFFRRIVFTLRWDLPTFTAEGSYYKRPKLPCWARGPDPKVLTVRWKRSRPAKHPVFCKKKKISEQRHGTYPSVAGATIRGVHQFSSEQLGNTAVSLEMVVCFWHPRACTTTQTSTGIVCLPEVQQPVCGHA